MKRGMLLVVLFSIVLLIAAFAFPFLFKGLFSMTGHFEYLSTNDCNTVKPSCPTGYTADYDYLSTAFFDNTEGTGWTYDCEMSGGNWQVKHYRGECSTETAKSIQGEACAGPFVYRRVSCYPAKETEVDYSIKGYAKSSGSNVNGATIKCESPSEIYTDSSDADGYFHVTGFSEDTDEFPVSVECTATRKGYKTHSESISVTQREAETGNPTYIGSIEMPKEEEAPKCVQNHYKGYVAYKYCEGDNLFHHSCTSTGWSDEKETHCTYGCRNEKCQDRPRCIDEYYNGYKQDIRCDGNWEKWKECTGEGWDDKQHLCEHGCTDGQCEAAPGPSEIECLQQGFTEGEVRNRWCDGNTPYVEYCTRDVPPTGWTTRKAEGGACETACVDGRCTEPTGCLKNHYEGEKRNRECDGQAVQYEVCKSSGKWLKKTKGCIHGCYVVDGVAQCRPESPCEEGEITNRTCDGDYKDWKKCGANNWVAKSRYCERGGCENGECLQEEEQEEDEGCKTQYKEEGTDEGQCQKAIQVCKNGQLVQTQEQIKPSDEVCNDKDDDCDGEIDELEKCEKQKEEQEQVWIISQETCGKINMSEAPEHKQTFSTQQGCEDAIVGEDAIVKISVWNPGTGRCVMADSTKVPNGYKKLTPLIWDKNPTCSSFPYSLGFPEWTYFTPILLLLGVVVWKRREVLDMINGFKGGVNV